MKSQRIWAMSLAVLVVCLLAAGAFAQVDKHETQDVQFGDAKRYDHARFSMNIPAAWNIKDGSKNDETILTVMDPTENAVLVIHVWKDATAMSEASKTKLLKDFLTQTLGSFKNMTVGDPKTQKDQSIGMYFKYDQDLNGKAYPMYGDSFVDQRGDSVALLFFVIPKEQYDRHQQEAYKVINSFALK